MTATVDLHAYFERIRWGGATTPVYATLAGILQAHMATIPFENLDVLLGRPVRLDLEGVQAKLVASRRGGYCFEHVTLFAAVLERLGFAPVRHSARVVLFQPRTESPRAHMFVTVPLPEGTFVIDPGFGSLAPRRPLPLADGVETRAGQEWHALVRDGPHWILRALSGERVVDAWVTTLEQDHPVDFEMANHYVATHRDSPFVNLLMLRALTAEGRVTVMNRDVTFWRDGKAHPMQLADRAALRALLAEHFGVDLPEVERLAVPSIPEWN